jgi:Adenylate and Guanylate cyclase catalytic domain
MRFGLHSGPVTAGVLRSQNARFQLFGDTVNTAARMESNGSGGMVHMSQETADELLAHGKHGTTFTSLAVILDYDPTNLSPLFVPGWFYPRSEKITAKGKGELQTYWLDLSVSSIDDRMSQSTTSIQTSLSMQRNAVNDRRMKRIIDGREVSLPDVQICRLVDWILDTVNPLLCRIVCILVLASKIV